MKATELLTEQHEEVRAIFKQLSKPGTRSKERVERLADSLAAHMTIEQELFYPEVMKLKKALVMEGYEEHAVARFALQRLWETPVSDRTFEAKVKTLMELVEHHVEEEEQDLFPKVEKSLGEERSEELGTEMKALFMVTKKEGYESSVGMGGSAVTSAIAPDSAHPPA